MTGPSHLWDAGCLGGRNRIEAAWRGAGHESLETEEPVLPCGAPVNFSTSGSMPTAPDRERLRLHRRCIVRTQRSLNGTRVMCRCRITLGPLEESLTAASPSPRAARLTPRFIRSRPSTAEARPVPPHSGSRLSSERSSTRGRHHGTEQDRPAGAVAGSPQRASRKGEGPHARATNSPPSAERYLVDDRQDLRVRERLGVQDTWPTA